MLIYAAPLIIWMIMQVMRTIMLTWPNAFNAWMCIFTYLAIGLIFLNFLFSLAQ